jgi:hypothetical protein
MHIITQEFERNTCLQVWHEFGCLRKQGKEVVYVHLTQDQREELTVSKRRFFANLVPRPVKPPWAASCLCPSCDPLLLNQGKSSISERHRCVVLEWSRQPSKA